jgi:hypothetical protein
MPPTCSPAPTHRLEFSARLDHKRGLDSPVAGTIPHPQTAAPSTHLVVLGRQLRPNPRSR